MDRCLNQKKCIQRQQLGNKKCCCSYKPIGPGECSCAYKPGSSTPLLQGKCCGVGKCPIINDSISKEAFSKKKLGFSNNTFAKQPLILQLPPPKIFSSVYENQSKKNSSLTLEVDILVTPREVENEKISKVQLNTELKSKPNVKNKNNTKDPIDDFIKVLKTHSPDAINEFVKNSNFSDRKIRTIEKIINTANTKKLRSDLVDQLTKIRNQSHLEVERLPDEKLIKLIEIQTQSKVILANQQSKVIPSETENDKVNEDKNPTYSINTSRTPAQKPSIHNPTKDGYEVIKIKLEGPEHAAEMSTTTIGTEDLVGDLVEKIYELKNESHSSKINNASLNNQDSRLKNREQKEIENHENSSVSVREADSLKGSINTVSTEVLIDDLVERIEKFKSQSPTKISKEKSNREDLADPEIAQNNDSYFKHREDNDKKLNRNKVPRSKTPLQIKFESITKLKKFDEIENAPPPSLEQKKETNPLKNDTKSIELMNEELSGWEGSSQIDFEPSIKVKKVNELESIPILSFQQHTNTKDAESTKSVDRTQSPIEVEPIITTKNLYVLESVPPSSSKRKKEAKPIEEGAETKKSLDRELTNLPSAFTPQSKINDLEVDTTINASIEKNGNYLNISINPNVTDDISSKKTFGPASTLSELNQHYEHNAGSTYQTKSDSEDNAESKLYAKKKKYTKRKTDSHQAFSSKDKLRNKFSHTIPANMYESELDYEASAEEESEIENSPKFRNESQKYSASKDEVTKKMSTTDEAALKSVSAKNESHGPKLHSESKEIDNKKKQNAEIESNSQQTENSTTKNLASTVNEPTEELEIGLSAHELTDTEFEPFVYRILGYGTGMGSGVMYKSPYKSWKSVLNESTYFRIASNKELHPPDEHPKPAISRDQPETTLEPVASGFIYTPHARKFTSELNETIVMNLGKENTVHEEQNVSSITINDSNQISEPKTNSIAPITKKAIISTEEAKIKEIKLDSINNVQVGTHPKKKKKKTNSTAAITDKAIISTKGAAKIEEIKLDSLNNVQAGIHSNEKNNKTNSSTPITDKAIVSTKGASKLKEIKLDSLNNVQAGTRLKKEKNKTNSNAPITPKGVISTEEASQVEEIKFKKRISLGTKILAMFQRRKTN